MKTRPRKLYLGIREDKREIFRASETPTFDAYPQYGYVVGPFRTKGGAEFMRDYGQNNPHCVTVSQAERLALHEKANKAVESILKG